MRFINTPSRFVCVFGGLVVIIGFVFTGYWKSFYQRLVASKLQLENNTDAYEMWKETAVPLYMKFYLYDWQNPKKSLYHGEKPRFIQKGPYVFYEHHVKKVLDWNKSNNTVTFYDVKKWIFMPNMSNGTLDDTITNINVVAVAVTSMLKNANLAEKLAANLLLKFNERSLYITKTVRELIFDGYRDKILDLLIELKKIISIDIKYEKFAWWYGKNMTDGGAFNILTGFGNINNLGNVYSWSYNTTVGAYDGECGQVGNSSIGDLWPMNIAKRQKASIFIPDLCSRFTLTNDGNREVNELEGTTFVGMEDIFDNGTKYEEATCFCPNNVCNMPSGVRNASPCLGVPAFISYPNFYLADETYVQNISGVSPNKDKHVFRMTFQKDTGTVIEANARLQINILLEPVSHIGMVESVPTMLIPTIWFEQSMELTPAILNKLKLVTKVVPTVLSVAGLFVVFIGTILLVSGLINGRRLCSSKSESMENLTENVE